ncbi:DUF4258 domain-containing protein [Sansalvadorimonas verongulae]|uniref:DUF4258 domain-containing protein n=1 Tax=Sansalvadorimonas verongulae TaxID=2172824 RepID=UPI002E30647F|nr:DUF4258 domain-containing protein [Sansalvadorimonas verongulae]
MGLVKPEGVYEFPLTERAARKIIQDLAKNYTGRIFFSKHVRQRMQERKISNTQILNILSSTNSIFSEPPHPTASGSWKFNMRGVAAGEDMSTIEGGVMYHYKESGLNNIFLVSGFHVKVIDDEEYVSFDNVPELHQAIGKIVAEKKAPLNGNEIRFLRVNMNLSQKLLGRYLDVDSQTVARWEKDQVKIPRASDVVLRGMFIESVNSESGFNYFLEMLSESEGDVERNHNLVYDEHWLEKDNQFLQMM